MDATGRNHTILFIGTKSGKLIKFVSLIKVLLKSSFMFFILSTLINQLLLVNLKIIKLSFKRGHARCEKRNLFEWPNTIALFIYDKTKGLFLLGCLLKVSYLVSNHIMSFSHFCFLIL